MSIGTVNSVSAVAGDRDKPAVRVRRTAVTFDSAGAARMGGLPRFSPVATDFADLTRRSEPVVLGGRVWTPPDLVAAVAGCLVAAEEPAAAPVATYPACYGGQQLSPLRDALKRSGAADTVLMPEPVAAVEWLDAEHGVSESGLTLVYDLGGNSLDVAVVRTEGDRDERGVLGRSVRSRRYGGRALGTVLARYARALEPGTSTPVSEVVPTGDATRLRSWNVRNSLRLVRKCVYGAELTMRDIDRVLLVGGAARPPEVAQVLAELGRPVVMSSDPAHTVAVGAAMASARLTGAALGPARYTRGVAVVSSAAVASAVAVSAASMLGSGPIGTDGPALEFAPALAGPARDARHDLGRLPAFESFDDGPSLGGEAEGLWSAAKPVVRSYGSVAQAVSSGATATVERAVDASAANRYTSPTSSRGNSSYADPARFTNPMPFAGSSGRASNGGTASAGGSGGRIPSVSLPGSASPRLPGGILSGPSDASGAARTGTGMAGGNGSGTKASDGLGKAPSAGKTSGTSAVGGWSGGAPGASGRNGGGGFGAGPTGGQSPSGAVNSGGDSSSPAGAASGGSAPGGGLGSGGVSGGDSAPSGPAGGGSQAGGVSGGGSAPGGPSGGGNSGVSGGGSASGGSDSGGSASDVGKASGGSSGGTSHSEGSSDSGGSSNSGGSSGGKSSGNSSGGGSKSGGSSGGSHGGSGGGGGGGGSSR